MLGDFYRCIGGRARRLEGPEYVVSSPTSSIHHGFFFGVFNMSGWRDSNSPVDHLPRFIACATIDTASIWAGSTCFEGCRWACRVGLNSKLRWPSSEKTTKASLRRILVTQSCSPAGIHFFAIYLGNTPGSPTMGRANYIKPAINLALATTNIGFLLGIA
jgi:hypothetical protein